MKKPPLFIEKQSGMMLLEGLIAILIFSMGILSLVGMQTVAVKQVTDAKYRSDACLLANQLIGTMWTTDRTPATLQAQFNTGGAGYTTWLTKVTTALPGVDLYPPTVVVSGAGVVTVTVKWMAPGEASGTAAHTYVAVAQML